MSAIRPDTIEMFRRMIANSQSEIDALVKSHDDAEYRHLRQQEQRRADIEDKRAWIADLEGVIEACEGKLVA